MLITANEYLDARGHGLDRRAGWLDDEMHGRITYVPATKLVDVSASVLVVGHFRHKLSPSDRERIEQFKRNVTWPPQPRP